MCRWRPNICLGPSLTFWGWPQTYFWQSEYLFIHLKRSESIKYFSSLTLDYLRVMWLMTWWLWGEMTRCYSHIISSHQISLSITRHININRSSIMDEQHLRNDPSSSPSSSLPGPRRSVQSSIVWSWLMIAIVRFCHHLINPDIISKQRDKTTGRFVQPDHTAGLEQKAKTHFTEFFNRDVNWLLFITFWPFVKL